MNELQTMTAILIERLEPDQLHEILEGITTHFEYGCCPFCSLGEIPVGSEWQEQHADGCPATLIEAHLMLQKAKDKIKESVE